MMRLILLSLFFISGIGWSQDTTCNQIPIAKPDVHAKYDGDIAAYLKVALSDESKKGTYSATFRMYVDCSGDVVKARFESGTLIEQDQKSMLDLIMKMKWTPAEHGGKQVLSNAYIVLEITNGTIAVKVY